MTVDIFNYFNNPHDTCNICPGSVYNCHQECGGFALLTRDAMTSIMRAADRGDVGTVLLLAPIAGNAVRYNPVRQAVQIMSCSMDAVIATLPVRHPRLLALASRLRNSQVETQFARWATSP